jgi:zinc and cadmium transporter
MIEIILSSFFIMLASLVGVISVWKNFGAFVERNLIFLVSFSAGVFLVLAYQLSYETIEHSETLEDGIIWIFVGAFVIWLLFKLLPGFHHHHDQGEEEHAHSRIDARKILLSDGLHNIGDGILLAAAFAVNTSLGFLTALSIFIHELVQEVSEFFVLKEAGYSTKKALALNFLVSSTILIGALGSFFLLENFEIFEVPLLGIAAGAFLIVVFHDLIPHSVRTSHHTKRYIKHLTWFLIGVLMMIMLNTFVSHGHEIHDDEHGVTEEIINLN